MAPRLLDTLQDDHPRQTADVIKWSATRQKDKHLQVETPAASAQKFVRPGGPAVCPGATVVTHAAAEPQETR